MQHRLLAQDDEEEVHRDMDRASDQVKDGWPYSESPYP